MNFKNTVEAILGIVLKSLSDGSIKEIVCMFNL